MLESIDIDDEVFRVLRENAEPFVDTPNDVLRRLLGIEQNGRGPSLTVTTAARGERPPARKAPARGSKKAKPSATRAARGSLLPESEYELPILRYLDRSGGRAPSKEVIEAIGQDLDDRLTETDKQPLHSGEIRWKSRAAFVRLRLVERGELDGQAPRGTWEITDKGRARVSSKS